jgi:addiction module RelB/DinJ family antitoxin
MNTAVINIKTNRDTKRKAQEIASSLGFSLSSLINGYLKQLVKTKTVHFELADETPSQYLIQSLKEAEKDRNRGKYRTFENYDDALSFVDKIINENKKN